MNGMEMLALSLIQGITEWLPVSSSAHLALAQYYFLGEIPIIYDLWMHVGTMLAAIIYFRERIWGMLGAILTFNRADKEFNTALFILLGSIPTAIIGFSFKGFFISMYNEPLFIGAALLITAFFLISTSHSRVDGKKKLSKGSALWMGTAQGLAVAPGISRSGATISTGLHCGLDWKEAASFSFLLAIPAIFGATLFLLLETPFDSIEMNMVGIGVLGAFLSGYAAIHVLMNVISRNTLPLFAIYCAVLGIVVMMLGSAPCELG
jgi:undecaprenyl-diphosphatase